MACRPRTIYDGAFVSCGRPVIYGLDEDFYPSNPNTGGPPIRRSIKVQRVADIPDAPAEDIAALVDPFCYISHLSRCSALVSPTAIQQNSI